MKRKKKEIQIDPDAMAETALKVFADAALMLEVASREHYRRHDDHAAHADELVGQADVLYDVAQESYEKGVRAEARAEKLRTLLG